MYDALNQNRSLVRNVTDTYIEDVQSQVLKPLFYAEFYLQPPQFRGHCSPHGAAVRRAKPRQWVGWRRWSRGTCRSPVLKTGRFYQPFTGALLSQSRRCFRCLRIAHNLGYRSSRFFRRGQSLPAVVCPVHTFYSDTRLRGPPTPPKYGWQLVYPVVIRGLFSQWAGCDYISGAFFNSSTAGLKCDSIHSFSIVGQPTEWAAGAPMSRPAAIARNIATRLRPHCITHPKPGGVCPGTHLRWRTKTEPEILIHQVAMAAV